MSKSAKSAKECKQMQYNENDNVNVNDNIKEKEKESENLIFSQNCSIIKLNKRK